LLTISLVSASVQAQNISLVVLRGQFAPGTNGQTYLQFLPPAMNKNGKIAFIGEYWQGQEQVNRGVFLWNGTVVTPVAVRGQLAPGSGGVFSNFSPFSAFGPAIDDSANVAFMASIARPASTSPPVVDAIYLYRGGSLTLVALSGQTAPGTGGGRFASIFPPAMNGKGSIAFAATLSGSNPYTIIGGLFVYSAGTITPIGLVGQQAPGTNGGLFLSFGFYLPPAINDRGDVAFYATVTGPGPEITSGIFLYSDGKVKLIALEGQTGPAGDFLGFKAPPAVNGNGAVAFTALVRDPATGVNGQALILYSAGQLTKVAASGQAAPGTGGGVIAELSAPSLNDGGAIGFNAIASGVLIQEGRTRVYYLYSGGSLRLVVMAGQAAPTVSGDVFSRLGYDYMPSLNERSMAFVALVSRVPNAFVSPAILDGIFLYVFA